MNNFGVWCALAILGSILAKGFLDWVWWYNWEDEGEENPAPLVCATWRIWRKLREAHSWLWSRFWWPPQLRLTEIWRRFFPPEPFYELINQDGRTPTEWLLIEVIGVWGMKNWYEDEYDWEVKRNWDEFQKNRDVSKHPEGEEQPSAQTVD